MAVAVDDRRRATRFDALLLGHLKITVRPGNVVSLKNLASGGALVTSARPLRPHALVHLQITGASRVVRLTGLVLRCGVAGISADGITYLGAVKFDAPCDLPWEDWRVET